MPVQLPEKKVGKAKYAKKRKKNRDCHKILIMQKNANYSKKFSTLWITQKMQKICNFYIPPASLKHCLSIPYTSVFSNFLYWTPFDDSDRSWTALGLPLEYMGAKKSEKKLKKHKNSVKK